MKRNFSPEQIARFKEYTDRLQQMRDQADKEAARNQRWFRDSSGEVRFKPVAKQVAAHTDIQCQVVGEVTIEEPLKGSVEQKAPAPKKASKKFVLRKFARKKPAPAPHYQFGIELD